LWKDVYQAPHPPHLHETTGCWIKSGKTNSVFMKNSFGLLSIDHLSIMVAR